MIKIEISCQPEEFDAHLKALGYTRPAEAIGWTAVVQYVESPDEKTVRENLTRVRQAAEGELLKRRAAEQDPMPNDFSDESSGVEDAQKETTQNTGHVTTQNAAPTAVAMDGDRERGKAGPGHRRRTNEQIKSDEAYFAAKGGIPSLTEDAPLAPGSEAPLISTGEERLDPRDAADEAAETAARKSDKPTREDLRAAVGRYTEKFGPKASIDNIRQIIGKPMIEVTEDEMAAAITRVEAAIAADGAAPSELAPAEPAEAPQATKADVVEAFLAYGKKYDGTDIQANMSSVREDMPKILEATFGAGVVKISAIPQTPEGFGKALAAVNTAVRDNPFKREVKG